MDPRRPCRNLLLSLVSLWVGCVQVPSQVPPVEQAESRVAAVAAPAPTRDEPTGPGSRPPVDEKLGLAQANGPARPDATDSTAAASPRAEAATEPPTRSGPPGTLTLEAAKSLAGRLNPTVGQSLAAVETAAGNEEISYSGFLPTLQGNYSYQAFTSQTGFAGTPVGGRFPILPVRGFGPGTQEFHVTELQLKWVIYQFGRQLAKHDQSTLREEIARLQADRARQSVDFDVSEAYFRALEARSSLVIAEQALVRSEAILEDARKQERQGVLTAEDVLRAEVQVAEVRQLLTRARSQMRVTVAALNRAIGLDVGAPTEVAERREEPRVTLTLEDALGLALGNRREIFIVRRGIADAELDVKIARADFLPTLSIQSTVSDVTGTRVQNANVLGGGIFAVLDVYTGGKRRGQLRTAQAEVWRATAQAKQVCDGVAYEVHYAHAEVEDAHERIVQARSAVAQARENLRLVGNRYRAGDAQPTDVIEAQTTLTRAEQGYSAALYQYQTAVARLEFAVGARVTAAAVYPEALAVPPPPTTPSPFAGPETPTPSGRPSPFRLEIPSPLPPLEGSDLFQRLAPPPPTLPTIREPSGEAPSGAPGLSRPPYVPQPPGQLP